MTDAQQREEARQFFYKWNGKGKEDEDARSYLVIESQNDSFEYETLGTQADMDAF